MGYVMPVQMIQSQQYANRIIQSEESSLRVGSVSSIQPVSSFDTAMQSMEAEQHAFEQQLDRQAAHIQRREASAKSPADRGGQAPKPYLSFIQPNPANLSPLIAKITGKGRRVNAYA